MEPWGRIGIGVLELIASLLILFPATTGIGAVMGMGLMSGAIYFHLTVLGLVVQQDGGQLFVYALLVFVTCLLLVLLNRSAIVHFIKTGFKYLKYEK